MIYLPLGGKDVSTLHAAIASRQFTIFQELMEMRKVAGELPSWQAVSDFPHI